MSIAVSESSSSLRIQSAISALMLGWLAAVASLSVVWLTRNLVSFFEAGTLPFIGLVSGVVMVPYWFLLGVPLYLFLRPTSKFWRYPVAIPFGAVTGAIFSFFFFDAISAEPRQYSSFAWIAATLAGASAGSTMFAVLARRSRFTIQATNN